jgi:diacylglycerol kinase
MNKSYFQSRLKSFSYAWKGIVRLFNTEPNAKIHLFAAIASIALGLFLDINLTDWVLLAIVIIMVIMAELFNTALEELADVVSPEKNKKIKMAKDYAAGAVLFAAILAVIAGAVIFLPRIFVLLF